MKQKNLQNQSLQIQPLKKGLKDLLPLKKGFLSQSLQIQPLKKGLRDLPPLEKSFLSQSLRQIQPLKKGLKDLPPLKKGFLSQSLRQIQLSKKGLKETSKWGFFQYGEPGGSIKTKLCSFLLSGLFLCLSSCATLSEEIDDLSPRDRKSRVLKILGSPFKIDRKDGEDHWIYKFVEEGRHYTKTVVFKDNMLLRTEKRKPYSLKRF